MRLLTITHQEDAGPGVFSDVLAGVEAVGWRPDLGQPAPDLSGIDAAVVLGGAANAHETEAHPWLHTDVALVAELVRRRIPTLGVCLGAQLLAHATGGSVRRIERPEIGWYRVELDPPASADPVLGELPAAFTSFQWHSYEAVPPPTATTLARSEDALQAFRLAEAPAWGIQFHAEVSDVDAAHWIEGYAVDPDAVAMGFDPQAFQREAEVAMPAWHELGRGLFARFLAAAREGHPSRRGRPSPPRDQAGNGSGSRVPGV